jgi:nucleoid-associated protein YgaU
MDSCYGATLFQLFVGGKSMTYYGDMNKWKVIYDHPKNRETIGHDYNLIIPGQKLIIP